MASFPDAKMVWQSKIQQGQTQRKFIIFLLVALILILLMLWAYQRFSALLPSEANQKTEHQDVNWQQVHVNKIEVYKQQRLLKLLDANGQTIKTYQVRLGFDPTGHKKQEGDGKTPEGRYVIDWRNPKSQFYKSLHVSYPNQLDQSQAAQRGVSAGGDIMIHGSAKKIGGSEGQLLYNYFPRGDWTWGCIAISNQDMDELWKNVKDQTVIEIFP